MQLNLSQRLLREERDVNKTDGQRRDLLVDFHIVIGGLTGLNVMQVICFGFIFTLFVSCSLGHFPSYLHYY